MLRGDGVVLAAGPLWLLVVYREVIERDLRRAGMSMRQRPSWARTCSWILLIVAVVITADSQVVRQKDLYLVPHLSILRWGGGDRTRDETKVLPQVRFYLFFSSYYCIGIKVNQKRI